MDTQRLKAPFPYFGGKSKIADLVWQRFGTVQNFVEPFFGSGAMLLAAPWPADRTETVNDVDALLANFWRALACDPEAVATYADWPVNECVPANTMIATPAGDIPVEQIVPGMLVWGERDGRVVATRVTATKQSQAAAFYDVGPLRVTGNHPIWTAEQGYQEARLLTTGMRIAMLNSLVDKLDLVMLYYPHECATMGNLHTDRPAHQSGAICGRDISRQETIQRASIARRNGRQNAPRLLDTLADRAGFTSYLSGDRTGAWRRLARSRAPLDSTLSGNLRSGQSYRWGRWNAGLHSYARVAPEVVSDACRRALSARSRFCYEGQAPHARGPRQDQRGWSGPRSDQECARENLQSPQGQGAVYRAQSKALNFTPRQATSARSQAEDRRVYYEPQASALCGDGASLPLSDRSGPRVGSGRSIGQSGDTQGLPLQRESLPVPVAVYNFQTDTHNYFANRILVHNCDLHARHRYLRDRRGFAEELMQDPERYDAKLAGWWVWGISQWIGSGWCPPVGAQAHDHKQTTKDGEVWRKRPHVSDDRGVHRDLPRKRPVVAGTGTRTHRGLGVHRGSLHEDGAQVRNLTRKVPHLGDAGRGPHRPTQGLYDYFEALSARLRRVRVCCGDWTRVTGPSVTFRHGLTAVFLDPPYAQDGRADVYAYEQQVFVDVRAWAIGQGERKDMRIALCGYDFEMPEGWTIVRWKAAGGYGGQGNGRGRENSTREMIAFSPHCLNLDGLPMFAYLRDQEAA